MLAGHRDSARINLPSPGNGPKPRYSKCYGARLKSFVPPSSPLCLSLAQRALWVGKFSSFLVAITLLVACATSVLGQTAATPMKADLPKDDEIGFHAIDQDSQGSMRYLHKNARIETSDMVISADEIRYNSDTAWAYAQGHVKLEHFLTGDKVQADHAEYNLKTQTGKFYVVDGTAP